MGRELDFSLELEEDLPLEPEDLEEPVEVERAGAERTVLPLLEGGGAAGVIERGATSGAERKRGSLRRCHTASCSSFCLVSWASWIALLDWGAGLER